jgi:hypothetical protein
VVASEVRLRWRRSLDHLEDVAGADVAQMSSNNPADPASSSDDPMEMAPHYYGVETHQ